MKRRIIAIGGGAIGKRFRGGAQTRSIDEEIVKLASKRRPNLLFIPTASLDDRDYCTRISDYFGAALGCRVEFLRLFAERPDTRLMRRLVLDADIIYVGGGNTLRMMNLWRRLGLDRLLDLARRQGTVLCGLSAGSICWFRQGNSDSRKFSDASDKTLIRVSGLNYVDLLLCPHYDVEKHRQPALRAMMRTTPGVAVALENGSALEIIDERWRILTSMKNRKAWKVYWSGGVYHKQRLPANGNFASLAGLLARD